MECKHYYLTRVVTPGTIPHWVCDVCKALFRIEPFEIKVVYPDAKD